MKSTEYNEPKLSMVVIPSRTVHGGSLSDPCNIVGYHGRSSRSLTFHPPALTHLPSCLPDLTSTSHLLSPTRRPRLGGQAAARLQHSTGHFHRSYNPHHHCHTIPSNTNQCIPVIIIRCILVHLHAFGYIPQHSNINLCILEQHP